MFQYDMTFTIKNFRQMLRYNTTFQFCVARARAQEACLRCFTHNSRGSADIALVVAQHEGTLDEVGER